MAYGILVPWSGLELVPSALELQSLNHWTSREAPTLNYLDVLLKISCKCEGLFLDFQLEFIDLKNKEWK